MYGRTYVRFVSSLNDTISLIHVDHKRHLDEAMNVAEVSKKIKNYNVDEAATHVMFRGKIFPVEFIKDLSKCSLSDAAMVVRMLELV